MAPQVEITIPNTSVASSPKPHTVYNISLRLPLRSFTVQKRYSDFRSLHDSLTDVVGTPPPATLPPKTWFGNSVSNSELAEERRIQLESYLQKINRVEDTRWRNSAAWRAFLNLPTSVNSQINNKNNALQSALTGPTAANFVIGDPLIWLDYHRDLKTNLHDARLHLTNRDQAENPQKQHEASAAAKSCLVKASGMIKALEEGLVNIRKTTISGQKLGDGEVRRRRDLISAAKRDRDGLENLLNAMVTKSKLDSAVASIQQKEQLVGSSKPRSGRVLGRETDETRELDNQGVLQLQKQKMADQDQDVDELRKIILRQKELGMQINQELAVQNEMLNMLDEDTDRVKGKLDIAKKRIGKIS